MCGTITDFISGLANDICGGVWFECNLALESLFQHKHPESQNSIYSPRVKEPTGRDRSAQQNTFRMCLVDPSCI